MQGRFGRSAGSRLTRAKSAAHAHPAEALERRMLRSVQPLGLEFPVNQYNSADQAGSAVAVDAGGGAVVVWTSDGQDGSFLGVYARRFDSAGVPRGDEFGVNQTTDYGQFEPSVSAAPDGRFVVVWTSILQDGEDGGVYGRLYSAEGVALGDEFLVNETVAGHQVSPCVAMDAAGDFVIAWRGSSSGIYARRFDAAGTPEGGEIVVSESAELAGFPLVASDADGDFVVTWVAVQPGATSWNVYGRSYDAAGVARGDEFLLSGTTRTEAPLTSDSPLSVAMDEDGDFVVAWDAYAPGRDLGIYARRFDAAGGPLGNEFAVGSTPGGGFSPQVAAAAGGAFVVAWADGSRNSGDVFARYYHPSGDPDGVQFIVNETATNRQNADSVAMDPDGDFIVTWSSYRQDGSGLGVYARRFEVQSQPPPASVSGRHVFYNRSAFDGNNPAANAVDDAAIAADKRAYPLAQSSLPRFENVTSYDKGINGVMVDIANLPAGGLLGVDDFDFGTALRPASVTVRRGAGAGGSDRVTLVWTDYSPGIEVATRATANGWLRVTVKANERTGLAEPDVFSFGNLIGESGDGGGTLGWRVSALDLTAARRALNTPAAVDSPTDFNRDGRTSALDLSVVRGALNRALPLPVAPTAAGDRAVVRPAKEVGLVD